MTRLHAALRTRLIRSVGLASLGVIAALALSAPAPSHGRATGTLHLVAIGDSLPYGQADCGYCATFVDLFGKALARATGRPVVVTNLSEHTGIDSADLRAELGRSTRLRAAVEGADAVTVTIGHNDPPWNSSDDPCDGPAGYPDPDWTRYDAACLSATAASYKRNIQGILRAVRSLRAGKPTLLRVTNDYDDLIGDPQIPVSSYPIAEKFLDTYSALTCRMARMYKAICVDTYHAFNGPDGTRDAGQLLAGDHTHPNPRGHRLIARLLERAGFAPLR